MAQRKRRGKSKKSLVFYLVLIIVAVAAWLSRDSFLNVNKNLTLESGNIAVYFVDVGQGNCTVIQKGNSGVLIDSGEREYAAEVVDFLESKGISELSYVIASHPHSDHIGSMANVLRETGAGEIFMPYIADKYAPTSKTYLNLLKTLNEKEIKTRFLKKNISVNFDGVKIDILVPVEQDNDFNNMSLIVKVTYGDVSFIVPADAENRELQGVFDKNPKFDFSSDFMLMAHHGSNTSLCYDFLYEASPKIAVISCGKDNSYGHPHEEIIDYLENENIKYYRTDESGTVSVITDGKEYNIKTGDAA